jgi:hypothetical protein
MNSERAKTLHLLLKKISEVLETNTDTNRLMEAHVEQIVRSALLKKFNDQLRLSTEQNQILIGYILRMIADETK